MERLYFTSNNNTKEGPFKLEELLQQFLKADTLIYRNDLDSWKSIEEFEELNENILLTLPKLPIEIQKDAKILLLQKTSVNTIKYYVMSSILLALITTIISMTSWHNYQSKLHQYHNNIYSENSRNVMLELENRYSFFDIQYRREIVENSSGECNASMTQESILRPWYALTATNFVRCDEKDNFGILFLDLLGSCLKFLFIIFILLGIYQYFHPPLSPQLLSSNAYS